MRKAIARLRGRHGFSFAESLIAMLIMLLAASIVAAGIPVAADVLKKSVEASNAQVLLSTTMTALRDELTTATELSDEVSGKISYYDNDGVRSEIEARTDGIYLSKWTLSDVKQIDRLLVSKAAATGGLYATFTGVDYDDGVVTFTGLSVKKGASRIAGLEEELQFRIRVAGQKTDS